VPGQADAPVGQDRPLLVIGHDVADDDRD